MMKLKNGKYSTEESSRWDIVKIIYVNYLGQYHDHQTALTTDHGVIVLYQCRGVGHRLFRGPIASCLTGDFYRGR